MMNQNSIRSVENSTYGVFCKPLYEDYCFSNIPDTIRDLLGLSNKHPLPADTRKNEEYEDVVFILVDGFGWRFFKEYAHQYPFLKRFIDQGVVSKITSQFPSTTAAHITSLNTGLRVGESGVYEWFQYEPILDQVICPLLFSYAGDKIQGTLGNNFVSPGDLFPYQTFYEDLSSSDVDSFIFSHEDIVESLYSNYFTKGSTRIGYSDVGRGLTKLADLMKTPSSKKRYFYFYLSDIDSAGHRHGCNSPEFKEAVDEIFIALEECFYDMHLNRKTACLMSADHGMIDVDPKKTIYINEELPAIKKMIKKNKEGKLIVPAGSCRDFFLHIQDDQLSHARKLLEAHLQDKALVIPTKDLIDENFFGPVISDKFLERVGNLVVLPYDQNGVWWHEKPKFSQHFFAVHGGLSRQEMETIFLFLEL